jgi:hypothetical protein
MSQQLKIACLTPAALTSMCHLGSQPLSAHSTLRPSLGSLLPHLPTPTPAGGFGMDPQGISQHTL